MYPVETRRPRVRALPTRQRRRRGADRRVLGLAGGVAALLVAGSIIVALTGSGGVRSGDCVIGIDLSQSVVENEGLLDQYLDWTQDALLDCAEDDATNFAVFAMTNVTLTDVVPPVVQAFDEDSARNPDNRRQRIVRWIESDARGAVAEMVDRVGPGRGGTDILAATAVAQDHFRPGADVKRLILLTDGLNTQDPANVLDVDLSEDGIDEIILGLSEDGRLARIADVDVEMYGIALGQAAADIAQARLSQIENLWRRFVEASGGRLTAYERTYSRG